MAHEVTLTVPLVGVAGCLANNDCKAEVGIRTKILLASDWSESLKQSMFPRVNKPAVS